MSNSLRSGIVLILIFFASLFIYTKIFGPVTLSINSVNTDNHQPFQTTGTGEATGTPDKASVSLGVTTKALTSNVAKNQANEIINKVTTDLKNIGIKDSDIKTSNFSVYGNPPVEPLTPETQINTPNSFPVRTPDPGFTANATIDVKTNSVDLANRAIDLATNDGANAIGGVNFTFDDATQKTLEQEAMKKAVDDAKEKANNLAKAANIKLGKITNITLDNSNFPMPFAASAKSDETISGSTNLNPGQNTVTANVTLTFEVK